MLDNVIVIPYRDRANHLDIYITETVPLIQKYLENSKVVVIEQQEGKPFNRGVLLNIGFKEYNNKTKYFITHDVDIIPSEETIKTVYTKDMYDIHAIKTAHVQSLGGVVKMKHDVVFDINGFPNNIWGWGIEDRALYHRSVIKDIHITRQSTQKYTILPHPSNAITYTGEKLHISNIWDKNHINTLDDTQKEYLIAFSGINNVEYSVIDRKNIHDIVEVIKVDFS